MPRPFRLVEVVDERGRDHHDVGIIVGFLVRRIDEGLGEELIITVLLSKTNKLVWSSHQFLQQR